MEPVPSYFPFKGHRLVSMKYEATVRKKKALLNQESQTWFIDVFSNFSHPILTFDAEHYSFFFAARVILS